MSLHHRISARQNSRLFPIRSVLIAFFFLAMMPSAHAASAGDRALAWAESQRDAALGSVMVARNRVEAAERNLTISRNIEHEISNSKDAAALSVAREAITVSEQGVVEARALLKRAMALLSKQENTVSSVKEYLAGKDNHRGLLIPTQGEVRRVWQGVSHIETNPSAPLRAGESIEVGPGGSARLFVADGDAEVALSENSKITVTRDQADDSFEAMLSYGFARIRAKLKNYGKKFEVRTSGGSGAIRGTDFSVSATSDQSRFEVFEGVVWVHPDNSDKGVEVHAGEGCDILKDGGIQPVRPLDNRPRGNPWSNNAP